MRTSFNHASEMVSISDQNTNLQLVNNSRSGNKDAEEERGHRDIGCGKERVWPEYDGVSCNTVMCTLIANYDLFTFSMFLTD